MSPQEKIWLITGVSSGFGRCLADRVTAQDDKVAGTLRKDAQIEEFNHHYHGKATAIRLDVTKPEDIENGVREVLRHYGRIDVLVNNAGYGLFGAVEEISVREAREQMETNFFGALAMTQAVLPAMRKQHSGHIVQISSVAGFCASPGFGMYNASKFALEGFSEALALEIAPLGIHLTMVEPGPFRTQFLSTSPKMAQKHIEDYAATAHTMINHIKDYNGKQDGDPEKAADAIIRAVHSDNPPLRLPLGKLAIERMRAKMAALEQEIRAWEEVSLETAYAA